RTGGVASWARAGPATASISRARNGSLMGRTLVRRDLTGAKAHPAMRLAADQTQRQGGDVLHAAGDDVALAVRHQAQRQQLVAQEVVEGVHVAGDDAQDVV